MNIQLFNFSGDDRLLDKSSSLNLLLSVDGALRVPSSIVNPTIAFQIESSELDVVDSLSRDVLDSDSVDVVLSIAETLLVKADYAYIPDFNRYYWVTDITSVRTGLWQLSMSCDVLMTFKDQIRKLNAFVDRNENSPLDYWADDMQSFDQELLVEDTAESTDDTLFGHRELTSGVIAVTAITNSVLDTGKYSLTATSSPLPSITPNINPNMLPPGWGTITWLIPFDDSNIYLSKFQHWIAVHDNLPSFITSCRIYTGSSIIGVTIDKKDLLIPVTIGDTTMVDTSSSGYTVNGLPLPYAGNADFAFKKVSEFTIPEKHQSYLDYSPYTEYDLYLPYKGWVRLDSSIVVGKKIRVAYYLGLGTSSDYVMVGAYDGSDDDTGMLVYADDVNIGMDLPLNSTNSQSLRDSKTQRGTNTALAVVGGVISTVAGIITAKPLMAVGGITAMAGSLIKNGVTDSTQHLTGHATVSSGVDGAYGYQQVILRTSEKQFSASTLTPSVIGRPYKLTTSLSTLTGLTICSSVRTDSISGATLQERNEIQKRLLTGVIL